MARRTHNGRTDLLKAALKRRADAEKLLSSGGSREHRYARGAGYLAGYAVECKLKAIAMEVHNCYTLDALAQKWKVEEREVYIHGLEVFAKRLPLWNRLRASDVWRDFAGLVNRWRVSWRYDGRDWSYEKARAFLDAVGRVVKWLDSNRC